MRWLRSILHERNNYFAHIELSSHNVWGDNFELRDNFEVNQKVTRQINIDIHFVAVAE